MKYRFLVVLNVALLLWYFLVFFNLNAPIDFEVMFATPDAQSYLSVSDWMVSQEPTLFLEHRPFLYPLFLLVAKNLGGVWLIWLLQFLMWIGMINFIFLSVFNITKKAIWAFVTTAFCATNLSLIALTFHALTEVATAFLLAFLLYTFIKQFDARRELSFVLRIVAILACLVVIKPTFSIPLIFIGGLILPLFYGRKFIAQPKKLVVLFMALIPCILQLTIMKVHYNSLSISHIGSRTFDRYILAQGIQELEKLEYQDAVDFALTLNQEEKKEIVLNNFSLYSGLFITNVKENVQGKSTFLLYPKGYENEGMAAFMKSYNEKSWILHLFFLLLGIVLFIGALVKKNYRSIVLLLPIFGLMFYYIFVTGISFFQGDRLVVASVPLWITLYSFLTFYLVKIIRTKIRTS